MQGGGYQKLPARMIRMILIRNIKKTLIESKTFVFDSQ